MSDSPLEEAHTGPIKNPKQLLIAVLFSFVVPVFVIIGLVMYVTSESKPSGSSDAERYALGGVSAQDLERGVAERIRKVGAVEIRDANRPLANGQTVFQTQCAACHTTGVAGAPKEGDAPSWANRLQLGFDALVQAALKGKGAMPPQAGGDFNDTEIARAVAFLANSAGGKFAEPAAPAAPAAAAAAPEASAPVAAAPVAVPAAAASAAAAPAAAPATQAAASGNGQALYTQACMACHAAGVAGAPKFGDKAAWAPHIAKGMPTMVSNAIKGIGAMPPKGGSAAPDTEIAAAVEYMVNAAK